MDQHSFIKCLECNTLNRNTDYCTKCGALINIVMKRRLENEKKIQKRIQQEKVKAPSKIDIFLEKGMVHPNSIVRGLFQVLYSTYVFVAFVVGGLIAAAIATAAG